MMEIDGSERELALGPQFPALDSQEPISHSIKPESAPASDHPRTGSPAVRNLSVKVHIRKAGRVAWKYIGRAIVQQEFSGQTSRVVIRSSTSGKVFTTFSEMSEIQADKRGNFIVVAAIESTGVTSWSLNTTNNSDALRLLASIELACYRCKQALLDPSRHTKTRRRIEKLVREDRRRRHEHKRVEDELVSAMLQQNLADLPTN